MSAPSTSLGSASSSRHTLHELCDQTNSLIVMIDSNEAEELQRRGLIALNLRCRRKAHYYAIDVSAVRLWARSRAGGRSTTDGLGNRVMHKANRPQFR